MAKKYLTGDGNMSTAGNWNPVATIPAADDEVVVGGLVTVDVTDTTPEMDDKKFDRFLVHRHFLKSFGTSGSPIITAADHVKLYSAGPCYFQSDAGGVAAKTDYLTIALARSGIECEIGSNPADKGDIDFIRALRGKVLLTSNIAFGAAGFVEVGYVNNPRGDCTLTIDASAPTAPLILCNGGESFLKNQVTALHISNSTVIKTDKKCTTSYVYRGGILKYNFENASSSEDIHVFEGGLLDLLDNEVPKDFGDVFIHPNGDIRYDESLHTFSGTFGLVDMRDEVL